MTETVLTEIIKYLESIKEQIPLSDRQHSYNNAINLAKNKAISLLPKEREDMEKAYSDGFMDDIDNHRPDYFEDNYKQYK